MTRRGMKREGNKEGMQEKENIVIEGGSRRGREMVGGIKDRERKMITKIIYMKKVEKKNEEEGK